METRALIGYLPEAPEFYRYLTGRELVKFYGELCGLRGAKLEQRVTEVIEWVGLDSASDRRVGTYSKGMLQRVGLAQALVHDPLLLVLDEPTAGVDPIASATISALILKLKGAGKTILITSHLLAQIEEVCDRIAILDRGRVILEGAVAELLGKGGPGTHTVATDELEPAEFLELQTWLAARGSSMEPSEPVQTRLDRLYFDHVEKNRVHSVR